MPSKGLFATLTDKAQSALNATPLAGHIPGTHASGHNRPPSPDAAPQPSANEAAGQGPKSHTMEALSYQFRALQQQYTTTTPVQKIITINKGIALDFDNVSRDAKAQSKELYTWGQTEPEDLKDVTDRLAYLNFVQGSLATSLSTKLETARTSFKALRDAEANLLPRRNIRAGIQTQIARFENDQRKVAELREQLRKAEADDLPLEKEIDVLKRKAVRDSEQIKWDAIREYGEKLVLLSQAATPIIAALPTVPPTSNTPYTGHQTTGAVRASLQRALDNYKTGHINLPTPQGATDLSRSDTRSFGESHASELSSIHSDVSSHANSPSPGPSSYRPPPHAPGPVPAATATTPQSTTKPLPVQPPAASATSQPIPAASPPIDSHNLNQTPAPLPQPTAHVPTPTPATTAAIAAVADPTKPAAAPLAITPTIAETGIPVAAGHGHDGPGPASGSLHDIKAASPTAGPRSGGLSGSAHEFEYGHPAPTGAGVGATTAGAAIGAGAGAAAPQPKHESAEEEKRRLAAMYSQPPADAPPTAASAPVATPATAPAPSSSTGTTAPHHETAEEEKKRLEREERERLLHTGAQPPKDDSKEEDLPPYQEPGLQ